MQSFRINNYWGKDHISVQGHNWAHFSPVVVVSQVAGAMTFTHTMTCDQAREMAAALLVAVSEAEAAASINVGMPDLKIEATA